MLLTDLADACRKSGLKVVEVDGWRTRGHGHMASVETIVAHHTASSLAARGSYPSLGIVRDGRAGLPGPLAQIGLGRDGTVYVIAAGVAYHAGTVGLAAWDNWHAIGIEAEHDGVSPWPAALRYAYVALCAALCEHYGVAPDQVLGHKEIARPLGRKIDPNFDMPQFREDIANHEGADPMADYENQLARIEQNTSALLVGQAKAQRQNAAIRSKVTKLVKKGNATRADLEDILAALDTEEN